MLPFCFSVAFHFLPMLFPWHLGYAWFFGKWPAFQTAELWGFAFLGTLTFFFQLCFLPGEKYFRLLLPAGVVLFIGLNGGGLFLKRRLESPDSTVKVLMVQHNVDQSRFRTHPRGEARRLIRRSEKNLTKDVDFILWPEGAYPYPILDKNSPDRETLRLKKKIKKWKTPLLTGGSGLVGLGVSNSLFFLDHEGRFRPPRYDKNYLLAFGEFIPGERWWPSLRKLFLGSARPFIAGREGPAVRSFGGALLGLQICYEGLFEKFSRTLALKGAHILLNVTNDSWFGGTFQPHQHLYMSLARGIETRRPVIRLTNTGFSGVMGASGERIGELSPLREIWVEAVPVPYQKSPPSTLFMGWGFYINALFLLGVFLIPLLAFPFKRKP